MAKVLRFQTVDSASIDRTDHVWFMTVLGMWKCCLCGAMTKSPPDYPTRKEWRPLRHDLPLTDEERGMCPYVSGVAKEAGK